MVGSRIVLERTRDTALIRSIALHPSIFPWVHDDHTKDPARWQPMLGTHVFNLVARDRDGYFGLGMFIARTHTCFDSHIGFLPRSYGIQALSAFRLMLGWMWEHTPAARLVGEIDVDNRRAIRFAERAGFRQYGLNEKSRLRDGVLRDQVCMGISRP
jgi:hypothetical protein